MSTVENGSTATSTTTYLALLDVSDELGAAVPLYKPVGEYTVTAGRNDKAQQLALADAAKADPERTRFALALTPTRGWKVETFEPEPPEAPRFKAVG